MWKNLGSGKRIHEHFHVTVFLSPGHFVFIWDKIEETLTANEEFLLASEYKNFWGATYRSFRHEHLKRFRIALSIWTYFAFHESREGDFPSFCQIQNNSVLLISPVGINPVACLLELGGQREEMELWSILTFWSKEASRAPISSRSHLPTPNGNFYVSVKPSPPSW